MVIYKRLFLLAPVILLVTLLLVQTVHLAAKPAGDDPPAWTCWDAGTADPCQRNVEAVSMLSATDGWAVGYDGLAMRWDGTAWNVYDTPTQARLNGVAAVAPDNVWAVGALAGSAPLEYYTTILHWDGLAWQEWPAPPDAAEGELYAIDMLSADYGLAVGTSGVLEWDGLDWQKVAGGSFYPSVSLLSPTDGWVVSIVGTPLHWNGETLTPHTPPPGSVTIFDVEMVATDDVWAVGGTSQFAPPVFWHWDGESWEKVPVPPGSWGGFARTVSMLSSDAGWAMTGAHLWHWNGDGWSTAGSITSGMRDMQMVSPELGWAVGDSGRSSRWDGSTWMPVPLPIEHPLLPLGAVDLISPTEGWAVGSKIHRWDGTTWQEVNKPESGFLRDVKMINSNDGWAVGDGGSILHWNGSAWTAVTSPITTTLTRVDLAHGDHGWAVGEGGVILGWDGDEWTPYPSPTSGWLYGVASVTPDDAWAVGFSGILLRWDGNDWTSQPSSWHLADIHMLDADTGWAVGSGVTGVIVHWDGDNWTEQTFPGPFALYAVAMNSATDGWAMGSFGQIIRWDGVEWQLAPSPTTYHIDDLALTGGTGFAAGNNVLLQWVGSAWQSVTPLPPPSVGATYRGIDAVSPANIWAVGQTAALYSTIIHWDGDRWAQQFVPSRYQLTDVAMLTETDGWAVGHAALILRWDGVMWSLVESPDPHAFMNSVDMLASDDVWIVGCGGLILHWDGDIFHQIPSGVNATLHDIHMIDPNNGWIVGDEGYILQWDGNSWEEVANPATGPLYGIHMFNNEEGWAVGSTSSISSGTGMILYWDGQEWAEWPVPDDLPQLISIHFSATDNGWAVGQHGVLLHWDGDDWSQAAQPNLFIKHDVVTLATSDAWAVGVGPVLRYHSESTEPPPPPPPPPPPSQYDNYLPLIIRAE